MNQISIGDPSAWIVLDGASVAAPFRRAAPFFVFHDKATVQEKIELTLVGTPADISTAISSIEAIARRAEAYQRGEYAYPQYLRFKPKTYFNYYAQISEVYLETSPTGHNDLQKGSLLTTLHYTRPNYFDCDQVELALTGRAGTDVTGGITIRNHTDSDPTHGNSVLIKPGHVLGDFPAPLRIEFTNSSVTNWGRIIMGAYHHPTMNSEDPFFCMANDMTGGTQFANAAAINGYYRTFTFTTATFASFMGYAITATNINRLDGRTYRPILNLFNTHAYTDLHLRLRLMFGTYVMHVSEAVYADPNYGYIMFPPVQLPPNQILREVDPLHIEIELQGLREGGAAASIDADQLFLYPIEHAITFDQFIPLSNTDVLVYDAHRALSNIRYTGTTEAVSHIRQGGPLLVYPNENNRLFFHYYNLSNSLNIANTAVVKAYYRPRVRAQFYDLFSSAGAA
jgi:hypothetical protein